MSLLQRIYRASRNLGQYAKGLDVICEAVRASRTGFGDCLRSGSVASVSCFLVNMISHIELGQ